MAQRYFLQKTGLLCAALLCGLLVLISPAAAAQPSSGAIAQGFRSDTARGEIVSGALVSAKDGDAGTVELAATDTVSRLVGVVDENPFLSISANAQQVQVVLSGTTRVLVSDINGAIKASDKITVSPIAGVGMKATKDSQVVGTVQADFDAAAAEERTITDSNGAARKVRIGSVPLQVGVAYYQVPGGNFLPPFVQAVADSIAGKSVSLVRILLCGLLLLSSFLGLSVLVYASVRSAMISLGRNPLAAKDIRKSLLQVGLVTLGVMAATLAACYLILIL